MKVSPDTLATLEFDYISRLLADRTVTPMARPLAAGLRPLAGAAEIAASLDEADEAVLLLEAEGEPPMGGIEPVEEVFERIRPEGSVLSGEEILVALRLCSAAEAVRGRGEALRARCPRLAAISDLLPDLRALAGSISGRIAPGGGLEDSASPDLGRIRSRLQAATSTLRARLEGILSRPDADKILSDTFITERGGRFVIPVRSDSPAPVRGIVHGGSSSGATLFIEPLATVELNNERVRLREAEQAEIERILRIWTDRLRERLEDLIAASNALARLDLAVAKGRLARDLKAARPSIEEGLRLKLAGARHPLLEATLAVSGREMVPIDLDLPGNSRTLIISGPNAGGKTIALKTAGLLALMAHAGLHVPASEAAFPLLGQLQVDIGDRQSIEGSLSTFSAHIQTLARIVAELDPPSLVLIDEIGTGTDPEEGGALAIALLERLRASGALTIATTHHGPVKVYGIETPGVASAAVEFDERTLAPTYRLLLGIAGASAGLAIAERLGLDPSIVEDARARIAPEGVEAERYLRRLQDLIADLERDREEIDRLRATLQEEGRRAREEAIRSDHDRAERFRGELAEALEEFRQEARRQLKGVAGKKEEIRLERERARREADLLRKRETLLRAAAPIPVAERPGPPSRPSGPEASGGEHANLAAAGSFILRPGARVVLGPYSRQGRVESIEGESVTVLVGSARFVVRADECLPPLDPEGGAIGSDWRATGQRPRDDSGGRESAPREIHLIGLKVEEALERLEKFLDAAALAGHKEVRIVHGYGTGRLRAAVRGLLSRHPLVVSHRPGEPHEGADGATVAALSE